MSLNKQRMGLSTHLQKQNQTSLPLSSLFAYQLIKSLHIAFP